MSLVQDPATGTAANVVPASTAPTAADAALCVTMSPNSPKSTIQPLYATEATLTITMTSLASGAARNSTAINNSTTLYEDVYLFFSINLAASGVSATGYVNIYGYGSIDGGSTYPEGITGTDATVTLTAPPNLVLLCQIQANTNGVTKTYGPISFCRQYGFDRLPQRWGVVVVNETGAALGATNGFIEYQGVNGQAVV